MRRVATTFIPSLAMDRRGGRPMHLQLYDWFRDAIIEGRIGQGMRVPSTRGLAAELNISRMPVVNAYDQLLAEGYFETFVGSGTRVARSIPDPAFRSIGVKKRGYVSATSGSPRPRQLSRRGEALANLPLPEAWSMLGPFRVSLPALDHFPIGIWSKLVSRHLRTYSEGFMAYGYPTGHLPLRKAIAEYVGTSRGVRCAPSQVIITTGSQQALQLAAHVLLNPGDQVSVEDPGYPGARQAFSMAGAELLPIPVDAEGIVVDQLRRKAAKARAVYVTPSHQYPLGMTMSAARRMSLLNWAATHGVWIIEDDYDSEFRFDSRPVAALQGLDSAASVIYLGTFSKVMFPALRLGYIIVPEDLVSTFAAAKDAADVFSSPLHQAAMTDFIQEGHFARHIRRMRMLYMERRSHLVAAIETQLGTTVEIVGSKAGMHLVALLLADVDDVEVSRKAASKGVTVMALSGCCLEKPKRGGIILGYGGTDARCIRDGVSRLRTIFTKTS